jgi:oligopeptidase A
MPITTSDNPLLQPTTANALPLFSQIKAEHGLPAMEQRLQDNRQRINQLLNDINSGLTPVSWQALVTPMEAWDDELSQAWSPISHMNSVVSSDERRDAYNACLPLLSAYSTEMGQNQDLYTAYKKLAESAEFKTLNTEQKTSLEHALRDFRLAGIALEGDKKSRYGEIKQRLSELTSKFGENVMDATQAWSKVITDKAELTGLPDSALALAQQQFQQKEQAKDPKAEESGYLFTLDFPSYFPVLTYCENRELRHEMYKAYATRASDRCAESGGDNALDNSAVMDEILALRHELAQLLDFADYSDYSVATKMANDPQQVIDFLSDLAEKAVPQAKQEFSELSAYAKETFNIETLEPWDIGFYSEQLRQHRYSISQELIRPYLPIDTVLKGMFETVKRLYGINIEEQAEFDSYHPDVRFFHIKRNDEVIAKFYLDLYARDKKRGGAWMDECRVRRTLESGTLQMPVAYLVCNFSPAVDGKPALLTHDELTTLFHEFGHGLHHMLTQIKTAAVSGINGVAWDAVELPSQFMENWCWEKEALAFISGHYETGESLPDELLEKMLAAKNFQSAMIMARQIEFSLFDFRMHREYQPELNAEEQKNYISSIIADVRSQVAVVPIVEYNRFQNSFSHIFAGGYAAGYYSYKWAEVLSADAFSRFEEEGIFNTTTGQSFLTEILQKGGSEEPAVLFEHFRGRAPTTDALLRHCGINSSSDSATTTSGAV